MKKTLHLADIVRSKDFQIRKLDEEHVDDLVAGYEAKADIEPMRVWVVKGRPNHWLTRGFHRRAALEKIGRRSAEVEIKSGTFEEAFADALSGNQGHGKRMTNKDKQDAAKKAIVQFPTWSDRFIADNIGVSHTFVANVRVATVATRPNKPLKKRSFLKDTQKTLGRYMRKLPTAQTADAWLADVIRDATLLAEHIKAKKGDLF